MHFIDVLSGHCEHMVWGHASPLDFRPSENVQSWGEIYSKSWMTYCQT